MGLEIIALSEVKGKYISHRWNLKKSKYISHNVSKTTFYVLRDHLRPNTQNYLRKAGKSGPRILIGTAYVSQYFTLVPPVSLLCYVYSWVSSQSVRDIW